MSSFKAVQFRIPSGENKSRSPKWASQDCINMYIDVQKTGRTESALMPWPGEKLYSQGIDPAASGQINRGFFQSNGRIYTVLNNTLYYISGFGPHTAIGTIAGSNRVSFATDGFNLLIRSNGTAAFINGKFILQGNGQTYLWNQTTLQSVTLPTLARDEYVTSEVNDPLTYRSINIGAAILDGDQLLQVYVFQRKIVMAGERSIEYYYDAPTGNPPLQIEDRVSTTQIGVASPYSMAETPSFLYLLGSDYVVYRVASFELQSVTPSSIAKELRLIAVARRGTAGDEDAAGFTVQIDGQWFYILQFRFSNTTLVYSETTGEFLRLSTGLQLGAHLMAGYTFYQGRHLISEYNSSNIYEWDFNTFTSKGNTILRQFTTAPVNGLMIGAPGQRLCTNQIRFIMESGISNAESEDPQMMVSASFDGGRSFDTEVWLSMRRSNDRVRLVDWSYCKTFYDITLRVRITDPVFTGFHTATIYLKPAGY